MKKFVFTIQLAILFSTNVNAQSELLKARPVIWTNNKLTNTTTFIFPFENQNTFTDAAIYFEKKDDSPYIIMRYRVFPKFTYEELRIKGSPTMMVKLGDGTILTAKEERVKDGILNGMVLIDVYFNLDKALQDKILKFGIEKVRIAYVFSYMGIQRNQIFDAYTKDSEITGYKAKDLLIQIQNANVEVLKKEAEKKKLNYGF